MSDKIKNYLNIAIIVAILAVGSSAIVYANAFRTSIKPDSYRSFSVSAEGKSVSIPDVAFFTFGVVTEGGIDIAKLQKENTEKINKAIAFLKSLKVDQKDIKTENYNLSPRYEYASCPRNTFGESVSCPPPKIVGYTINQTIAVKIRNFENIGGALSGIVTNGANSVSSLNFQIDDPVKVQNEAREEAIARAKEKARSIARAGDFRLGRLISIEEGFGGPVPMRFEAKALDVGFGSGGGEEPQIEPGSQETRVSVTLRYEIK